MPNRILRDWTFSPKVNDLTDKAEILFIRLIMKADDFGRYYADPRIILGNCYPFKSSIKLLEIDKLLSELSQKGLISLYESEQKLFLEIQDFRQRLRSAISKFPNPEKVIEVAQAKPQPAKRKQTDSKVNPSFDEIKEYCKIKMLPLADAEYLFNHWKDNDYTNNGKPIKDWKRTINKWMAAGYLPKNQPEYQREMKDLKPASTTPEPEGWAVVMHEIFPMIEKDSIGWAEVPHDEQQEIIKHLK